MDVEKFVNSLGLDYYVGVPDSQLRALCDYLLNQYGNNPMHHIIAANEGNAVAMAAGYYLSTGKTPVVYMQNSGIGNALNPILSLLHSDVYDIPCVFIVGWRGEPGIHDEPQHVAQGKKTIKLLNDLDITTFVIRHNTTEDDMNRIIGEYKSLKEKGGRVAFIVSKGALTYNKKNVYQNNYILTRERAIECIVNVADKDIIIATTGKASRELFEIRDKNKMTHDMDFLTVGSMGHSSSIALSIALQKSNKKIWCIDGDGALIMHLGAMAVIGNCCPKNMVHIVINNQAHESVGGMPTVAQSMDLSMIAKGCGYSDYRYAENETDLLKELSFCKKEKQLTLLEIRTAIGARADLGRPTISPIQNKDNFMKNL